MIKPVHRTHCPASRRPAPALLPWALAMLIGALGARPAVAQDAPAPAQNGAEPQFTNPDEMVTLSFPGQAVELTAFVQYVSEKLGINVFYDDALQNIRIVFQAPMEVQSRDLLTLLAKFVEERGFVLSYDPVGNFWQIRQGLNVVPNLGEGDFSTTRVIRTPLVKPSALQQPLTTMLGQTATTSLRFTAIDELGVLMVTGPPTLLSTVNELVQRILREQANLGFHRFNLEHVSSDFARTRILTLNGRLTGAVAPGTQPVQPGGSAVSAGALTNLDARLLTERGNSLIFRGTAEEAQMLAAYVELVDVVTPLIPRRYAAGSVAEEVARAGERMGLGPVTLSQGGATTTGGAFGGGRGGLPAATDQEVNGSGFTVDPDQGTIVFFGNERQHEIVANLVREFTEQQIGAKVEIKMYKLDNASAESVADVLQQIIQEGQLRTGNRGGFIPGARTQARPVASQVRDAPVPPTEIEAGQAPAQPVDVVGEGGGVSVTATADQVSIVADTDRNQIIIRATARQQLEFERLIRDLDQRQPQVYIEAQIVSVTTTDDFTWTVETQINAGQFLIFSNFGLTAPGMGDPQIPGQPASAVRTVPSNLRGVTSALIKSDYLPFVLNTLETEANARLESTPRILVSDNQEGNITSEREEPFSTTTQGTATTTTGQGGVATAGTNLTVTPRISSGGYVNLEYSVELSAFDRSTAQAQGLQPPVQRELYESTVQVPSDSTIVVGGFTLNQNTESESRIPILGSIPLIGNLFKSYSRNKQKITIFVFITPTIMTDPNFLDLRLATEGPMKQVDVDGVTPPLFPAVIPIREGDLITGDRSVPPGEPPMAWASE